MIDLHCHILPALDDGAADLSVALGMARAAAADGVSILACTPHILPGLYQNCGPHIREAAQRLQETLDQAGIPLHLVTGADAHIVPDFLAGLRSGRLLSLADSRYVLVEPPHHVAPARMEEFFVNLMVAGFVPILTHPERLSWIASHYAAIQRLVGAGVWMQLTAGSLTGAFGRNARYWAERMLEEGAAHVLATDAHDLDRRRPNLGRGRELAAKRVGDEEARHLVVTRPKAVIDDQPPSTLPMPVATASRSRTARRGMAILRPWRTATGARVVRTVMSVHCAALLAGCGASLDDGLQNRLSAAEQRASSDLAQETEASAQKTPARPARAGQPLASLTRPGSSAYKIGPQDVLDISVFKVPELSKSVQVADTGTVNLPLVGEILAAGKSAQEIEHDLTIELGGKYLQSPQVTVYVREYNSQRVTVEGAVKKPGVYALRGRTSLLQFIAMAEGQDNSSASGNVLIFREAEGRRSAARFDLDEIRAGRADDPVMRAGDVIVVDVSAAKAVFSTLLRVPIGAFVPLL